MRLIFYKCNKFLYSLDTLFSHVQIKIPKKIREKNKKSTTFFGIISKPCSYSYTFIVQIFTCFLRNLAFILKLYLMLYAYYRTNIDTALMPIEPTTTTTTKQTNNRMAQSPKAFICCKRSHLKR